jgi:hypothetical protein
MRQLVRTVRHVVRSVRSRPLGNLVVTPRADSDATVDVAVAEWSVYRGELRARLTVTDPARHVLLTMGDRAVRFRANPGTEQTLVAGLGDGEYGLAITLRDGRTAAIAQPAELVLRDDPSTALFERFVGEVQSLATGRVLEIGSRARSGTTYRQILPPQLGYTGLDIVEGPNVDIVGDAHDLAAVLPEASFSLVFSIAVFEHLAMPWKAALSINRVLAPGGLVFIGTHQTFPVHEAPWDFWRFSDRAWHSLFNRATGFEIVATAMGQPADIVPHASTGAVVGIGSQPAFLTSSVLARKVGEPRVCWDVSIDELDDAGFYPN